MFKNVAKKLVLGMLAAALLITSVVVAPTNTQAASKKAKLSEEFKNTTILIDGQKGYLKKYPLDLDEWGAIENKNKKAKYTYEATDKKAITITSSGKITAAYATKDETKVKIIVKETLNHKTRTIGTIKGAICLPRVVNKNVKWSAGQCYGMLYDDWFSDKYAKKNLPEVPFWSTGKCTFRGTTKAVTQKTINKWLSELNSSKKNDKTDDQGKYYKWKDNDVTVKDKAGKLNCAFFAYDYGTKKYYYVDSFKATIKKVTKAKSISLDPEGNFDTYDGKPCTCVGETWDIGMVVKPYDYMGKVTATSSDKSIAKVSVKEGSNGFWTVKVKGIKKGTVTITVKANGAKKSFKCKVLTQEQVRESFDW